MRINSAGVCEIAAWGLTAQAFASRGVRTNAEGVCEFQPRVGRTLGMFARGKLTLKALANTFSVETRGAFEPRVVASSNSGLELVNAFGVEADPSWKWITPSALKLIRAGIS